MFKIMILVILIMGACSHLKQINLKTGVGNELRNHAGEPWDDRFSVSVGPEFKLEDGSSYGFTYRHRITDLEMDSMEHGFFLQGSIPVWKK